MDNNYYQNDTNTQNNPVVDNNGNNAPKADALAIVSLVMGILSIVLVCCTSYIAIIPGVVGIVCSVLSKKNNGKTGVATAGLICSIVGIVFAVIYTLIGLWGLSMLADMGIDYNSLY